MKRYGAQKTFAAMLKDLVEIEPMEWTGYAFSREMLNRRFTDKQRQIWMKQSLECGKRYANKLYSEMKSTDPHQLAEIMGAQISYHTGAEKINGMLLAEFREPNQICIYTNAVEKASKFLEDIEILQILTEYLDITKLLLAHELFHYVEKLYKKEIFTQTETFCVWSLGPFHYRSQVIVLSEIAAMGFARELTGLPYFPYVMDMFLMYSCFPEEACKLYEEMMLLAGKKTIMCPVVNAPPIMKVWRAHLASLNGCRLIGGEFLK